jgi:hypothetical protein
MLKNVRKAAAEAAGESSVTGLVGATCARADMVISSRKCSPQLEKIQY